jgi:hypothetical protein
MFPSMWSLKYIVHFHTRLYFSKPSGLVVVGSISFGGTVMFGGGVATMVLCWGQNVFAVWFCVFQYFGHNYAITLLQVWYYTATLILLQVTARLSFQPFKGLYPICL